MNQTQDRNVVDLCQRSPLVTFLEQSRKHRQSKSSVKNGPSVPPSGGWGTRRGAPRREEEGRNVTSLEARLYIKFSVSVLARMFWNLVGRLLWWISTTFLSCLIIRLQLQAFYIFFKIKNDSSTMEKLNIFRGQSLFRVLYRAIQ